MGGQDATEAFEDVGHSDEAREILEGLLIGKLKRVVRLLPAPTPHAPNSGLPLSASCQRMSRSSTDENPMYSLGTQNQKPLLPQLQAQRNRIQRDWALACTRSSWSAPLSLSEHINTSKRIQRVANETLGTQSSYSSWNILCASPPLQFVAKTQQQSSAKRESGFERDIDRLSSRLCMLVASTAFSSSHIRYSSQTLLSISIGTGRYHEQVVDSENGCMFTTC